MLLVLSAPPRRADHLKPTRRSSAMQSRHPERYIRADAMHLCAIDATLFDTWREYSVQQPRTPAMTLVEQPVSKKLLLKQLLKIPLTPSESAVIRQLKRDHRQNSAYSSRGNVGGQVQTAPF